MKHLGRLSDTEDVVIQSEFDAHVANAYTLGGTDVIVADGGTGASDEATARTNLGLVIGTHVQAWDAALDDFAGLSQAVNRLPYFNSGTTMAVTVFTDAGRSLIDDADAAEQRATLGLVIDTDVTAKATFDAHLSDATDAHDASAISFAPAGTIAAINVQAAIVEVAAEAQPLDSDLTTLSTAFTTASASGPASLALAEDTDNGANTITIIAPAVVASNKIATLQDITGTLYVSGGTNVAIADGGTGADDAAGARTALGVVPGTDVQVFDADLTTIAGLTPTTNNFLVANASAWASRTPAQALAHLGVDADLATFALPASTTISAFGATLVDDAAATNARTTLGLVIGTDVQAFDADLTTLSTAFTTASASGPASLVLAEDTDNGANTVTVIAPAVVASNKIATLQDVTGTILVTGGTDVAVADGGTGASDAATARTNLGVTSFDETKSIWMSFPGVQITGTGVLPVYFPYTVEILDFHLSGLTNTTVTLDVNRSGTTMFVTQGNRPALSASQTDATSVPNAATNNQLTTSQYLTVDIDVATGSPANFVLRCDYKRI